ncbi:hypothetical protein ABFP60_01775 [Clostridioides difficile]
MKKKMIFTIAILSLLTGCAANNEVNNNGNNEEVIIEENIASEPEKITTFTALGKTYESSKDIMQFNEGDKIYDRLNGNPHVSGEYKEIDFALDLLTEYLAKNQDAYNYIVSEWDSNSDEVQLISAEDKERLVEEANFLGEQFMLNAEDPIYFKLDKVIVQEKLEEDNAVALELRGHLSATNDNFRPLGTFTVTVYNKGDKLYGSIF